MENTSRATGLTYDDLMAMFPEPDRVHRELIGGELFEMTPSPLIPHQRLVTRLALALGNHLEAQPEQGEVFVAPLDVVLTADDVVQPDLFVVLADQRGILTDKHVHGAPALVIEVLSPSTRLHDQRLKWGLFERQGVREFWMIDPECEQVFVYRRAADDSFPLTETLDSSKTLTTPLLPGWSLSLSKLFA